MPGLLPNIATLRALAPELTLVATILALLIAPIVRGHSVRVSLAVAAAGTLAALLALFAIAAAAPPGGLLTIDGLSLALRGVLLVFLLAILWLAADRREVSDDDATVFLVLLLCSAVGMCLMTSTSHLLLLILAIELASMPSFALVALRRGRLAAEAALKYVLFGAIISGFMIYGAALLFALTGSLHLAQIEAALRSDALSPAASILAALAGLALLAGIGFKIGAVPFHFWCPDVFEAAPLSVATWLSVSSKAAALAALLRCCSSLHDGPWPVALVCGMALVAAATFCLANLAAYRQRNVRRLLAYSSIAHAGYMLALAAAAATGDSAAAHSGLTQYVVVYAIMNFGAFVALGAVAAQADGREGLDEFAGLAWRRPLLAAATAVCLLSLVGLPPLAGFVAKFWVLSNLGAAALHASTPAPAATALWIVMLLFVANTAVSLYYYLGIVRTMLREPAEMPVGRRRGDGVAGLVVVTCSGLLLWFGTLGVAPLKAWADRLSP
jgi:NADH-quinone oxidoreductase subunit N